MKEFQDGAVRDLRARWAAYALLSTVACGLSACGERDVAAVDLPFAEACAEARRHVRFEGYVRLLSSVECVDGRCSVGFMASSEAPLVSERCSRDDCYLIQFASGEDANEMEPLEPGYSPETVVIRDEQERVLSIREPMRITAYPYAVGSSVCNMTVSRVERVQ